MQIVLVLVRAHSPHETNFRRAHNGGHTVYDTSSKYFFPLLNSPSVGVPMVIVVAVYLASCRMSRHTVDPSLLLVAVPPPKMSHIHHCCPRSQCHQCLVPCHTHRLFLHTNMNIFFFNRFIKST